MIDVKTYLKVGDEFLMPSQFYQEVDDPDYIEGAIELIVDGEKILNLSMWDYVDQLWAYLIDGLINLNDGKSFSTFFPDQPIEVKFTPQGKEFFLFELLADDHKRKLINTKEFFNTLIPEAENFFQFLARKLDIQKANSEELQKIERLKEYH